MIENPTIWVALGFIIFVAFSFKAAKKAILGALDQRALQIQAQLQEAESLRREAEALLVENRKRQEQAIAEAARIVQAAQEQAQNLKAQATAEIEAMTARRQQAALEKIAQAEAVALSELRGLAVDTAIAVTSVLLSEKITDDVASRLLDQAIADLPGRLN